MKLLAVVLSSCMLVACGGGGSSSTPSTPENLTVSGTAATGKAIAGATITAKCQVGTGTATTIADGTYSLVVAGGKLPCLLQITDPADGSKLHTVVTGTGSVATANITPLTEMLAARVLGNGPSVFFADFNSTVASSKVTSTTVKAAQTDVGTILSGIVDASFLGDFIATPLKAATPDNLTRGDAQDKLLDSLKLKFNSVQLGSITTALAANKTTDEIRQTVASMKTVPVAHAGSAQSVVTGTTVTLDASASSVGVGGSLTYTWTLISKPVASAAALTSPTSAKPTFNADMAGTYVASLVVSDGDVKSNGAEFTYITAETNIPFIPTPAVVATPVTNSPPFNNEYWKIEYTGSDAGFCDALYVNQHGNSYTQGMCLSKGKTLGDFSLSGIADSNGIVTLNMQVNNNAPVGAIFRGALHMDGTGSGTWSIPNSIAQGAWTATRYPGKRIYSVPSLNNPEAGSFASGTNPIHGIWKRPTTENFPEFALILPNGETAWQVSSPFGGFAKMFGTFAVQGSTWSLGSGSALYSASSIQNVNASGTFVPRAKIVGTMSAPTGNPVTLSFDSYSLENALALTLQDIAGTYIGGGSTHIGSDGTVTGSTEQGCKVRGKISEIFPGAKLNLFRAKITFYGPSSNPAKCIQTQSGPDYDGYIFVQLSGSERYLYSLLRPSLISIGSNPTIGMYSAYLVGHQIR